LKRLLLISLLSVALAGTLWSELRFSNPDLSDEGLLLFTVRSESPSWGAFDTLFMANLADRALTQLSHFPERLVYLREKKVLQLQNRFGVFQSDDNLESFKPSPLFGSFVKDSRVLQGSLSPMNISPNGRYLLYVRSTSPAFGDLVFVDLDSGEQHVISSGIEIDLSFTPTVWSPDSSFFVYSKNRTIFYMSVRSVVEKIRVEEAYRRVGEGQIGNVTQGGSASLYYLSDHLVYELNGGELFTRALYQNYLDIGRLVGKIPFTFDANFDSFWISPTGTYILLNKGGRNLFLYVLSTEDFSSTADSQSLPYLYLPRNTCIRRVLWNESGVLTVLASGSENGQVSSQVFRIDAGGMASGPAFRKMDLENVEDIIFSPSRGRAAVIGRDRVAVYEYESWRKLREYAYPEVLQVAWISEDKLVIAGAGTIELYGLDGASRRVLGISQPDGYSFAADQRQATATVGGRSFRWAPVPGNGSAGKWSETSASLRSRKTVSDAFRVYLEDTPDRVYQNMLMIRDRRGLITTSLLEPSGELEPFPEKDDPLDFVTFNHGSRIRRREIALVFNVIDSVEGLPAILSVLRDFDLRCTFFVNGEAIRRYPDAVREISRSGHEVGSLFSVYFDMTDSRFRLDKEFIKRGLARNEDEYYAATGRELSLLWHAPHYFVNSDIVQASREMNYAYIGRDVDPLDWVTREMGIQVKDIYFSASRLVEKVVEQKKPGSIVPVLAGKPDGQRDDYFFHRLDLLIDALIKKGYEIVPVSVLIEHAE
jgi:peptidoglycan/xylan/chitin deacetylase (PgdA/CDA1 family)